MSSNDWRVPLQQLPRFYIVTSDMLPVVRAADLDAVLRVIPPPQLDMKQLVDELILFLDDSDATAQFDAVAEKFHRETNMIRPGKSVPLEMSNLHHYDDTARQRVFQGWCKGWRDSLVHRLRQMDRLPAAPPAPHTDQELTR